MQDIQNFFEDPVSIPDIVLMMLEGELGVAQLRGDCEEDGC